MFSFCGGVVVWFVLRVRVVVLFCVFVLCFRVVVVCCVFVRCDRGTGVYNSRFACLVCRFEL